jgi:hypothetical protein
MGFLIVLVFEDGSLSSQNVAIQLELRLGNLRIKQLNRPARIFERFPAISPELHLDLYEIARRIHPLAARTHHVQSSVVSVAGDLSSRTQDSYPRHSFVSSTCSCNVIRLNMVKILAQSFVCLLVECTIRFDTHGIPSRDGKPSASHEAVGEWAWI